MSLLEVVANGGCNESKYPVPGVIFANYRQVSYGYLLLLAKIT